MLNPAQNSLDHLKNLIRKVSAHHLSCSLTFYPASSPALRVMFKLGRVVWATGGEHRFRRWNRLTQQFLPSLTEEVSQLYSPAASFVWEHQLLMLLLQQRCISRDCASKLIQVCLEEVLFEIFQLYPKIEKVEVDQSSEYKAIEPLIFPSLDTVWRRSVQTWQAWHVAGLEGYNLNAAPFIVNPEAIRRQTSAKTYQTMLALLRGQLSVRELARGVRQPPKTFIQLLKRYEAENALVFRQVPDCSPPWSAAEQIQVRPKSSLGPLVYCVDDSLGVCTSLKHIVESQGYRFSSTQDSVQALQNIIEQRPDIIFIDLIMPIMSGYEICTQLRRIQVFQDIPIIILTSNDGVVDRVRSKLVGAAEFASKPVNVKRILPILEKYVPIQREGSAHSQALAAAS